MRGQGGALPLCTGIEGPAVGGHEEILHAHEVAEVEHVAEHLGGDVQHGHGAAVGGAGGDVDAGPGGRDRQGPGVGPHGHGGRFDLPHEVHHGEAALGRSGQDGPGRGHIARGRGRLPRLRSRGRCRGGQAPARGAPSHEGSVGGPVEVAPGSILQLQQEQSFSRHGRPGGAVEGERRPRRCRGAGRAGEPEAVDPDASWQVEGDSHPLTGGQAGHGPLERAQGQHHVCLGRGLEGGGLDELQRGRRRHGQRQGLSVGDGPQGGHVGLPAIDDAVPIAVPAPFHHVQNAVPVSVRWGRRGHDDRGRGRRRRGWRRWGGGRRRGRRRGRTRGPSECHRSTLTIAVALSLSWPS